MAQLRSVTCHMGSHSVTCYPTQVNTPRLNPSHAGRYSIYLPRRDGRLSWPSLLDSAPAGSRTCDLSITSPTLNQCNHQDNLSFPFFFILVVAYSKNGWTNFNTRWLIWRGFGQGSAVWGSRWRKIMFRGQTRTANFVDTFTGSIRTKAH